MVSRASKIVVTLILFTCFVFPIVEMFDSWDDSVSTGNDTEYGLVVLALCGGVAYTFARVLSKSTILDLVSRNIFAPGVDDPSWYKAGFFRLPLHEDRSPPGLPLRT
jgi:hypothetical protein